MLIVVLINIAIIIWIYLRYYHFSEHIINTKEKVEEIDPILMGFINDRGFSNNYDLILAEIVNLNIKKYIIIEYDKDDKSKYNYTIKQNFNIQKDEIEKYDLVILDFLFLQKSEITRTEFEQKIINTFGSYNVQYNQLSKVLQEKLLEQSIIDAEKQKELEKVNKLYKKISIIIISLLLILKIFVNLKISIWLLLIYVFEILVSRILLLNASNYTDKGEIIRNNIIRYKYEINNKEFLVDKKQMNDVLLEKEFANSIALHINTDAKDSFINGISTNAIKSVKNALIKLFVIGFILIFITLILQKLTLSINSRDGILLLYIILTLIVATSADITHALSTSKKQK